MNFRDARPNAPQLYSMHQKLTTNNYQQSTMQQATFLFIPLNPVLFIAEPVAICSKFSSEINGQLLSFKAASFSDNLYWGSMPAFAFLFHGQTCWHISQPKIQPLNFSESVPGISFLFSMVRYEIHLRESITPGATMACVGHASIHSVQFPQ